MKWGRGIRSVAVALLAAGLTFVAFTERAEARELWSSEDEEESLELISTLKSSFLLWSAPGDPILYPETTGGAALGRLRFELNGTFGEHLTTDLAYEHRTRASSPSGGAGGVGILPPNAEAPFRIRPLEQTLVDRAPSFTHAHEIDRAYVALHLPFGELTVGRQPVGLGRGVLFGAVDLFAPFSSLEVDRDWRRGVDAVHAEVRFLDGLSADLIAAATTDFGDYAVLGRVRAVVGDVDGSVIVGERMEDTVVGGTLSATVGESELHGEFALYGTDGRGIDGGWLGTERVVLKAVAGGSHAFDVGSGLRLVAEYHYSGFGVADIAERPDLLLDPAFGARLARGDTQIIGRHAAALVGSYDIFDDVSATLTVLMSPVDGSGLVAPSLTWLFSDQVTLVGSAFVPWGARPEGGRPRSEYGLTPVSFFAQATIYD